MTGSTKLTRGGPPIADSAGTEQVHAPGASTALLGSMPLSKKTAKATGDGARPAPRSGVLHAPIQTAAIVAADKVLAQIAGGSLQLQGGYPAPVLQRAAQMAAEGIAGLRQAAGPRVGPQGRKPNLP